MTAGGNVQTQNPAKVGGFAAAVALSAMWLGLVAALGFSGAAHAAEPFSWRDIARVHTISGLGLSPDEKQAVFVESGVSLDGKRREQTIWLLKLDAAGQSQRLTEGNADSRPAWSPDGKEVAFLRKGDGGAQLYVMNLQTKQERRLTILTAGVEDFKWAPNGKSIALVSKTRPDPSKAIVLEPGVNIFTRVNYRTAGQYTDFRNPDQIWTLDPTRKGAAPQRLTHGGQAATLVSWSPDSSRILYTVNETDEPYYGGAVSGLYEVTPQGGAPRRIMGLKDPTGQHDLGVAPTFSASPDGSMLAFVAGAPGQPGNYAQPDLFVMDIASGKIRNLTADLDEDIDSASLAWRGNTSISAIAAHEAATNVVDIDVNSSKVSRRTDGAQAVHALTASPDPSGKVLAIVSKANAPQEVYDVSAPGRPARLTHVNEDIQRHTELGTPESIWFTASDGVKVQALLQKPPGFDPSRRYPLIVWNHGGPFNLWTLGFNADVQAMAGAGYLVLCPNPRGSQSYGQAFATPLTKKWPGGRDYEDVMDAVDFIAKRPYVDSAKMGVAGNSAGAIMTDWVITHTDRFAAAVSISDIADFQFNWYFSDQPRLGPNVKLPAFTQRGDQAIDSTSRAKTPTLFISGERDYRTPSASGAEMMFRALKLYHVPSVLMRFDTAGHSIYTSDYPQHPSLKIRYLLRWMDSYLRGVKAPEFDVQALD
jgi:dipeptidyl aminopeptidase/acylaminoacyl peptidase